MSRLVLEAAGPEIQEELNSTKSSSSPLRPGYVVVTKGYRLNASCVFHGILKQWDNGQDDAEAVSNVNDVDGGRRYVRWGDERYFDGCISDTKGCS